MGKAIEIFKPGTHVALSGARISFSDADLAAAAAAYDPALHEAPLVVGHPELNKPAYGWVKGLSFADGRLTADPDQVDPAFAEMVNKGHFKKLSASFYLPDAPDNPKPGVYYLRHVGFLGAMPPAVKGLKSVQFAGTQTGIVAFGDWSDRVVVRLFRNMRDLFIEKFGTEAADQALPADTLNSLGDDAAQPDEDDDMSNPAFAERQSQLDKQAAELAAREAKLKADEEAASKQRAEFAEQERGRRAAAHKATVDGLVKAGKVLPVHAGGLTTILSHLDSATAAIEFGEGDKKTTKTPAVFFAEFLAALPTKVHFSEAARPELAGDLMSAKGVDVPSGKLVDQSRLELHTKALAYAEKNKVDYATAAIAVERMG